MKISQKVFLGGLLFDCMFFSSCVNIKFGCASYVGLFFGAYRFFVFVIVLPDKFAEDL